MKRRRFDHCAADHRDTGRRRICIYSYERDLDHRRTDLFGERIVCGGHASGGKCQSFRIACRRGGTDEGDEKASGSIRIDLAQYREMEVFTQFSSDLDPATKEQLEYGSGLMELLKQPLYHPMSLHEKVITLCAATHKIFLGIDKKEIRQFRLDLMTWFDTKYPNIGEEIEEKKVLSDELIDQIVLIAEEFKKSR